MEKVADLIVVGASPVGLLTALGIARTGASVLAHHDGQRDMQHHGQKREFRHGHRDHHKPVDDTAKQVVHAPPFRPPDGRPVQRQPGRPTGGRPPRYAARPSAPEGATARAWPPGLPRPSRQPAASPGAADAVGTPSDHAVSNAGSRCK